MSGSSCSTIYVEVAQKPKTQTSEAELELLDIQVRPAVHRRTMAAIHCILRGCEQSCFEIGDSLKVVRIVIN
jgi:hypothetical protein